MNKKIYDISIIKDIFISIGLFLIFGISIYLLINTNNRNYQIILSFIISFSIINFFIKIITSIYFIKLKKLVINNKKMKEIEKYQKKYDKFGIRNNNNNNNKIINIYKYLFIIIFLLLVIITGINNSKIYILVFEILLLIWSIFMFIYTIKKRIN